MDPAMRWARLRLPTVWVVLLFARTLDATASQAASDQRIQVQINTEEAEGVLGILEKQTAQPVAEADWQRLFATEPYVRLRKREASMHREFTDQEFKNFVLSSDLSKRAPELRRRAQRVEES